MCFQCRNIPSRDSFNVIHRTRQFNIVCRMKHSHVTPGLPFSCSSNILKDVKFGLYRLLRSYFIRCSITQGPREWGIKEIWVGFVMRDPSHYIGRYIEIFHMFIRPNGWTNLTGDSRVPMSTHRCWQVTVAYRLFNRVPYCTCVRIMYEKYHRLHEKLNEKKTDCPSPNGKMSKTPQTAQ